MNLLCRNRVQDISRWKQIIDSHSEAHRKAGLRLQRMWRSMEDANNIFFLFEMESVEKARAFISDPKAAEAAKDSGVLDGEYHFLNDVEIR